jgi:osmotically-inducible protein OsmY
MSKRTEGQVRRHGAEGIDERYSRERDPGTVRARRLTYEEERRERDKPWSPSNAGDEASAYAGEPPRRYFSEDRVGSGNRGRGPKNYAPSDERIREQVCERMTDDDQLDASGIEVGVNGGEVTLNGTVPDRRSKRYAEDLADGCRGVKDVHNLLRIAAA